MKSSSLFLLECYTVFCIYQFFTWCTLCLNIMVRQISSINTEKIMLYYMYYMYYTCMQVQKYTFQLVTWRQYFVVIFITTCICYLINLLNVHQISEKWHLMARYFEFHNSFWKTVVVLFSVNLLSHEACFTGTLQFLPFCLAVQKYFLIL